jgi:predicted TIM-barrel fold metal-dependent hydrolase
MIETPALASMLSRRSLLVGIPLLAAGQQTFVPRTRSSRSLERRLRIAFDNLDIADTHEHFHDERDRVRMPIDFFTFAVDSYAATDLTSAGMPAETMRLIRDRRVPDVERWRAFEPYWESARYSGAAQALRLAIRDLYGHEPSASTIPQVNEKIRALNKPGLYRSILRDRSRIRFCVLDDSCGGCTRLGSTKENFELFVLARRFDQFILPTAANIHQIESETGVSIGSLDDLTRALEKSFQDNLSQGMGVVKVAVAYMRQLLFEEVGKPDAEREFQALMRQERPIPQGFRTAFVRPYRALEDYMFHAVMRLADAHRVPVQIHTGLFAGSGNRFTNSKVSDLLNTFLLYPRVQFDIFHASFPYQEELLVIAKSFPNVHADFCWAFTIFPEVARRTLDEFLDSVPVNKIFVFGGDYKHPELSYAVAQIARQSLAQVLARKVEKGWCAEQEALTIGKALLYDNAARFFGRT